MYSIMHVVVCVHYNIIVTYSLFFQQTSPIQWRCFFFSTNWASTGLSLPSSWASLLMRWRLFSLCHAMLWRMKSGIFQKYGGCQI